MTKKELQSFADTLFWFNAGLLFDSHWPGFVSYGFFFWIVIVCILGIVDLGKEE